MKLMNRRKEMPTEHVPPEPPAKRVRVSYDLSALAHDMGDPLAWTAKESHALLLILAGHGGEPFSFLQSDVTFPFPGGVSQFMTSLRQLAAHGYVEADLLPDGQVAVRPQLGKLAVRTRK